MDGITTVKRSVKDDDGRELLKISSDSLAPTGCDAADTFYKKLEHDFMKGCDGILLPKARKKAGESSFRPFGAVRRLTIAMDSPALLSVVCDVSIFDGNTRVSQRRSENWDKANGFLLSFGDIFFAKAEKELKRLISDNARGADNGSRRYYSDYQNLLMRHFSRRDFFVTEQNIGFYYQPNSIGPSDRPFVFLIPTAVLKERSLIKSSLF